MDVFEAIQKRRSIRLFVRRAIEPEKLQRVLEAGRLAPSARNMQNWRFISVHDQNLRNKLMDASKTQYFVGQAPAVIVGCGTMTDYVMSCGQHAYSINVAIAMTQMMLQAVEEGLGTCWVGAFDEEKVKELLSIPEDTRVVGLLPIGYPGEKPDARTRNPYEEVINRNTFA
jgi:nitroreductase